MNLQLDLSLAKQYENSSLKMRKVTEMWITQNLLCPYCGKTYLSQASTRNKSLEFCCPICSERYELKYKNGPFQDTLYIGAYQPIFQKIELLDNPNFLFLEYASKELYIKNLFLIPRYFFCVDTIQKRQPLTSLTRRQGWVGCDILFQRIPTEGFIYIVENMTEHTIEEILEKRGRTNFMRSYKPRAREWIIDLLNLIQDREFTLEEMCSYAPIMEIRYAGINNAEDRIRKVLQILRRNEIIAYAGNGKYVKTEKQFTQ